MYDDKGEKANGGFRSWMIVNMFSCSKNEIWRMGYEKVPE